MFLFDQMPWLLFTRLCVATIQGGVYFFGKPAGNIGWVQAIQWQLLDAASSARSLSVLLSALEACYTAQTALALAWWLFSEIISIQMLGVRQDHVY